MVWTVQLKSTRFTLPSDSEFRIQCDEQLQPANFIRAFWSICCLQTHTRWPSYDLTLGHAVAQAAVSWVPTAATGLDPRSGHVVNELALIQGGISCIILHSASCSMCNIRYFIQHLRVWVLIALLILKLHENKHHFISDLFLYSTDSQQVAHAPSCPRE